MQPTNPTGTQQASSNETLDGTPSRLNADEEIVGIKTERAYRQFRQPRRFGFGRRVRCGLMLVCNIFLLSCSILGFRSIALAADRNERRTVIVLVDESGTLKSDRGGWRRDAAALFAQALSDGSSMALAGFGNADRALDLRPRPLDSSPSGVENRRELERHAQILGDSDRQTDLYGAIGKALDQIQSMDGSVLRAARPAIVVLSDFKPDPLPTQVDEQHLCDRLRGSGADFIALGFGDVDTRNAAHLAGCTGTVPLSIVSQPSALLSAFWLVHRRLSGSFRIFDEFVGPTQTLEIAVPPWATELYVLAYAEDRPTSTWDWQVPSVSVLATGKSFRLARVSVDKGGSTPPLRVRLRNADHVRVSVVARGEIVLGFKQESPAPWISGEYIRFDAQLLDARYSQPAAEWTRVSKADYAGSVRFQDGTELPLSLDPESGSLRGGTIVRSVGKLAMDATANIDGATWTAHSEANIVPIPVRFAGSSEGRMLARAWWPGQTVKVKLESVLGPRPFSLAYSVSGPIAAHEGLLEFNAATPTHEVVIQAGLGRMSFAAWFHAMQPVSGDLSLKTVLANGQTIEQPSSIPIIVEFHSTLTRCLITIVLAVIAILLLSFGILGRRLPPWHLVPCDASGNSLTSGDFIQLKIYKRSLELGAFGMPGTRILQPMFGNVAVNLGPETTLCPGGVELGVNGLKGKQPLQVGDLIVFDPPNGNSCGYRVEKL